MFVPKEKAQVFKKNSCTVIEYGGTPNLDIGIAEIREKYPGTGWARNTKVEETYFVLEGSGKFFFENEMFDIKVGDLVMIEKGRWYRAEGNLKVLMACSPAWSVEQYEERSNS